VFVRNSTDSHRWWSTRDIEDAVDTVCDISVIAVLCYN